MSNIPTPKDDLESLLCTILDLMGLLRVNMPSSHDKYKSSLTVDRLTRFSPCYIQLFGKYVWDLKDGIKYEQVHYSFMQDLFFRLISSFRCGCDYIDKVESPWTINDPNPYKTTKTYDYDQFMLESTSKPSPNQMVDQISWLTNAMQCILDNIDVFGVTFVTIECDCDEFIKTPFLYTYTVGLQQTFNHPDLLFVYLSAMNVSSIVKIIVNKYLVGENRQLQYNQELTDCVTNDQKLKVSPLKFENQTFSANRSYYDALKTGLFYGLVDKNNSNFVNNECKISNEDDFQMLIRSKHFIDNSTMLLILWPEEANVNSDTRDITSPYYQEAAVLYLVEKKIFDIAHKNNDKEDNVDFLTFVKRNKAKFKESRKDNKKWEMIESFVKRGM